MLDLETYYFISIPGFVVGVMTGRFLSGHYWQKTRLLLGRPGKLMSGLFFLGYLASILLILGIMLIYLVHLPEIQPTKLGATILVVLWISANFILEIADRVRKQPPKWSSETNAVSSNE